MMVCPKRIYHTQNCDNLGLWAGAVRDYYDAQLRALGRAVPKEDGSCV